MSKPFLMGFPFLIETAGSLAGPADIFLTK
jgi:hypothetical protein